MSALACPECGARLLASHQHAGAVAGCPACGADVPVASSPAPPTRAPDAADGRRPAAGAPPLRRAGRDASRAHSGDVPPPRASGSGDDVQLPLTVAAISMAVPLLGPLALWLVARASRPIRDRGEEQPSSLAHARLMAITGTVLLVLALICLGPFVLAVG